MSAAAAAPAETATCPASQRQTSRKARRFERAGCLKLRARTTGDRPAGGRGGCGAEVAPQTYSDEAYSQAAAAVAVRRLHNPGRIHHFASGY